MKVCELCPMDNRVVVQPNAVEEQTPGGIVLPDNSRERPQRGTVIAVGPGDRNANGERQPIPLEVGDEVVYSKYTGAEVDVDGDELMILRESDILAVIRN